MCGKLRTQKRERRLKAIFNVYKQLRNDGSGYVIHLYDVID